MFRREFKNNLKNEIMRDSKFINDIFNFIEVIIDFNNKLYERIIKKNIINLIKEQKSSLN